MDNVDIPRYVEYIYDPIQLGPAECLTLGNVYRVVKSDEHGRLFYIVVCDMGEKCAAMVQRFRILSEEEQDFLELIYG